MISPVRFSSGCLQDTKLLKRSHAVVQADFFGNFTVLDPEHSRSGKPHLPAGRRRKGAGEKVAEAGSGVRAATLPTTNHIVAFGDEIGSTPEAEVGKRSRNPMMKFRTSSRP
jgi:hypothetical protein